MLEGKQQREVGSGPQRQMDVGGLGRDRSARVDDEQARSVGPFEAVAHAHPQHGLGLRGVVAPKRQRVAVDDVVIGAGLAIASEGLLQRLAGGRGAQPGIAVQMVGANPGPRDRGQRPVLLAEQLPGRVEGDRRRTKLLEQRAAALNHSAHRVPPAGLAAAKLGMGQAFGRGVGLPTEEVLRTQPSAVDAVNRATAHPDDAST